MERTPPAQEPETSIAKRMLTTLQLLRDKGCPRCKSEERSVETL
jgi:hypothetical protein